MPNDEKEIIIEQKDDGSIEIDEETLNLFLEDIVSNDYPVIDLESDDLRTKITLKKDYSDYENIKERKDVFLRDLKELLTEFEFSSEINELMEFYDDYTPSLDDDEDIDFDIEVIDPDKKK